MMNIKRNIVISMTVLLLSLHLFPFITGFPSTKIGFLPSFMTKNSELLSIFIIPCLREIFRAGPSSDRSMSTLLSFAERPSVTSRDCIRYLTIRPLKTASVLLSKSGRLTPVIQSTTTCHFGSSFSNCFISCRTLLSALAVSSSSRGSFGSDVSE
ncbi:hypothetical protein X975_15641, partial [Stegodyphus mimosarum]